jgi:hypothetical protein
MEQTSKMWTLQFLQCYWKDICIRWIINTIYKSRVKELLELHHWVNIQGPWALHCTGGAPIVKSHIGVWFVSYTASRSQYTGVWFVSYTASRSQCKEIVTRHSGLSHKIPSPPPPPPPPPQKKKTNSITAVMLVNYCCHFVIKPS